MFPKEANERRRNKKREIFNLISFASKVFIQFFLWILRLLAFHRFFICLKTTRISWRMRSRCVIMRMMRSSSSSLNFNNQFSSYLLIDCWCGKLRKEETQRRINYREMKRENKNCLFVDVVFYSLRMVATSTTNFSPKMSCMRPAEIKKVARGLASWEIQFGMMKCFWWIRRNSFKLLYDAELSII